MSYTENSNSQYNVNNFESKSPKPIQSTQEKQNSLSATDKYVFDVTGVSTCSTHSCTKSNVTSAQNNATSSAGIQSDDNISNIHGIDLGGSSFQNNATISGTQSFNFRPSSQSNDNDSRSYMSHYVRRTLSGLTTEAWAQYRTKYPDNNNHFQKKHPNVIECTQVHPRWYRIVSIGVNTDESNASFSSSQPEQPQKVQRTINGRRSTAGVTNSQSDVEWYRKVNRDVIESQISVSSSRSERLERRDKNQHQTLPLSSFQTHLTDSRIESSVNNINRAGSLTEPITSNIRSNENVRYRSDNVIDAMIPPALHCQLQNLNSNQARAVSIFSNSEHSAAQDTTNVPSSIMTNNSNRAQVFIDLDDFATNNEDRPVPVSSNSLNAVSPNSLTHAIGIIPALPPTSSSVINEPETLEVIIRSRNNADYNLVISNPAIIRMHKVLQRCISRSNNTSSSANNTILFQQVNNYMRVLRSTILSTDSNSSNISSLMGASIPRTLTIDHSLYPLVNTTEMPPVTIIDRIQNGCVIKELTNCAICLEDDNGNVLLEPCEHYNMCGTCMERLTTWICPICRSYITKIIVYV